MTMMPDGAAASRAAQKSAIAGVIHERSTDAAIGELLARLQGSAGLASELGAYEQVGGAALTPHGRAGEGG